MVTTVTIVTTVIKVTTVTMVTLVAVKYVLLLSRLVTLHVSICLSFQYK